MMKTVIKITAFLALLILLLWYLMQVFTYPKSGVYDSRGVDYDLSGDFSREKFNTFYRLDHDILDCVFLGSSGTDRYWLAPFAWHDHGLATFTLTTPSQNIAFTKNLIIEVRKTQDVRLFIVDLRGTVGLLSKRSAPVTRRVTDNMKISRNWIDTILTARKVINGNGGKMERLLSYLYTPYKYHSMWSTMTIDDYIDIFPQDDYMGYFDGDFAYRTKDMTPCPYPIETVDIPEANKELIDELAEYCRENDVKVVFTATPVAGNKKLQQKLKGGAEYVRKAGFDVYDCNTPEMYDELDWDFTVDHYNGRHANFRGAVKYTEYWSRILMDRYGLKDHRSDADISSYARWDKAYDLIMDTAEVKMPEEYQNIVSAD